MAEALGIVGLGSAFAWVQVRLRGGWTNLLVTSAVYGAALGITMYFPARMVSLSNTAGYYSGWVGGLLGLQAVVLLLFAGSRVTAAVRLDFSTRMIESHRLMPTGPASAVAGYLVGATSQALCLAAVTFLLGVFASAGAGLPPDRWLWANVILALFAAFAWAVLAYFAFFARLPFLLLLLPIGAVWLSQGFVLTAVPALAVLCSPAIGWSVFAAASAAMDFPHGVAALAQVLIGAIFFEAARRKYRRDDAIGMGPVLGLLLLAGFAAVSWVGLWHWVEFAPRVLRSSWVHPDVQVFCSLLCMMLLGMVPLAAAARVDSDRHRRLTRSGRTPHDEPPARRVPDVVVVALAAAVVAAFLWVTPEPETGEAWSWNGASALESSAAAARSAARRSSVVVLLHFASFSYAARAAHRLARWPRIVAAGWVLATWLVPLMADLVRYAQVEVTRYDEPPPQPLTWLSTCSPVGALLTIWRGSQVNPLDTTRGLWVQAGLAALTVVVFHATRRGRRVQGAAA